MSHRFVQLLIGLLTVGLAACQTAGTGSGNVRGTHKPVAFTWQSADGVSGGITATFGTGRVFRGNYFQISNDIRAEQLGPLWDGWGPPHRHGEWRHWARDPGPEFYRKYSGRVLANLHADDGESMRCKFTLISPSRGMAGGGEGHCQLSDSSQEIEAEFPRQPG